MAPHEFPWLVALFDHKRNYFCGGSLVSNKHIITGIFGPWIWKVGFLGRWVFWGGWFFGEVADFLGRWIKDFWGGPNDMFFSAAHCTVNKQWVLVELGKHELDNRNEPGVALRISETIYNHPEYAENTGHADISIIVLSERVSFSEKVVEGNS